MISIFGLEIYTFNICVILAIVVAIMVFVHQTNGILEAPVQDSFLAVVGADIPFAIAGAVLHNKIAFAHSIGDFVSLLGQNTGIAFFGGFIGGFLGFMLLYRPMLRHMISRRQAMELIAPPLMIGHAIGRIGCLMGGCCFGKPFYPGIRFAEGTPAYQMYGGQALFPSQLVEASVLCAMFAFSLKIKRHKTEFYRISYCVFRFLLEFMRGDRRGNEGFPLSPAQMISILVLSCTLICICGIKRATEAEK